MYSENLPKPAKRMRLALSYECKYVWHISSKCVRRYVQQILSDKQLLNKKIRNCTCVVYQ